MTATAAAAAAAVVAAAIPAFSAILCTRGDLAAPTIVRRVFWAKLFLAIEVLRFEACHVRVVTVRLSIFVSVLRRAAVLEDNAYKSSSVPISQFGHTCFISPACCLACEAINAPAAFIHPCRPTVVAQPPSGPGWAHEVKYDGYRLQIHVPMVGCGFTRSLEPIGRNAIHALSRLPPRSTATQFLMPRSSGSGRMV